MTGLQDLKVGKYQILSVTLWIVFYLVVIDVAINLIFRFPADPAKIAPTFLQGYFEYGRSVEGKLDRMTRNIGSDAAGILGYGWLKDERYDSLPKSTEGGKILVAVYGMSHTKELGKTLAEIDRRFVIRDITAPGAPPNWSFAAYELDKEKHAAKVVILGIMTDAVPYLGSTAGMTSYFEMSHPYTYPRYHVENGQLNTEAPPYYTSEGFKEYYLNPGKWESYRSWLEKNDKYYDTLLFSKSMLDSSAMIRVLRRSYSEKIKEKRVREVYTAAGFNVKSEEVASLQAIIKSFARMAREQKSIPIIYLVNNEGRGDHLYQVLKPVLEANEIPFLSTHAICPPDDPTVYTGINSHFIPSKDQELAREIIKIIERERKTLRYSAAH